MKKEDIRINELVKTIDLTKIPLCIGGWDEHEIYVLYSFVYMLEEIEKAGEFTFNMLKSKFPDITKEKLKELVSQLKIRHNFSKLDIIEIKSDEKKNILCMKGDNRYLIKNIRNAFCHGTLQKVGDYVLCETFYTETKNGHKKGDYSSYFRMDFEKFKPLVEIITNHKNIKFE